MSKIFATITKVSIYAVTFLLPIFFLPFTVEPFEFNKIYLLFFITSIGILAWLVGMIYGEKQLKLKKSFLDIFVAVYLLAMVLSAIFSLDANSSVFGFYGKFWPSLLGVLSLGGFYFLVVNNVVTPGKNAQKESTVSITTDGLVKTICLSGLAAVLIGYGALMGIWEALAKAIPFLPQIMQVRIFNPVGGLFVEGYLIDSLELLSLFTAFVLALIIGWLAFYNNEHKQSTSRIFQYFVAVPLILLGTIMMAIVDFWPAWLALLAALITFLIVALKSRAFKNDINRLAPSVILIGLALFFLLPRLFGFVNPLNSALQQNKLLGSIQNKFFSSAIPQKLSWQLAWEGLRDNPVLGSGTGNFSYVFSKFKPELFGQVRFDRPTSFLAETVATTGALGSVAYLLFLAAFCGGAFWLIKKQSRANVDGVIELNNQEALSHPRQAQVLPLVMALIALMAGQLFYWQGITLAFSLFLICALVAVHWSESKTEKTINFKDFPEVGLIFNVVMVAVLVGVVLLSVPLVQRYLADVNYRDYLVSQGIDIAKLETAVKLAKDEPSYHSLLALAYLDKFNQEIAKPQPDSQVISNMLFAVRESVKKSVALAPNNAIIQEVAAAIYRDLQVPGTTLAAVTLGNLQKALEDSPQDANLMAGRSQVESLIKEFQEMPISAFERSITLDPKNFNLYYELGKLKQNQNDLKSAQELYQKALSLNGSYVVAALQLALVEEQEGQIKEATARLEGILQQLPAWVEARFHLGRIYYNEKNYDKATQEFQTALQYFPHHSNSMYSLAKIYQKQGDNAKALELLEKVLKLNTDNQDLIKEIDVLKGDVAPTSEPSSEKGKE